MAFGSSGHRLLPSNCRHAHVSPTITTPYEHKYTQPHPTIQYHYMTYLKHYIDRGDMARQSSTCTSTQQCVRFRRIHIGVPES